MRPLPGRCPIVHLALLAIAGCGGCSKRGSTAGPSRQAPTIGSVAPLTVRLLDVGQGDAVLITNGRSTVLIDGGPDPSRLGKLLDSLRLGRDTIDVVVLSHQHYDHYSGLRELFRSRRHLAIRFFFENRDPSAAVTLDNLRDSVDARARRGALVVRDTDDPCADGSTLCTIPLAGGAKLHVMRPEPGRREANDRSAAVKLVGPDSASFTMWLAGDAQHSAIGWFDEHDYDRRPGMRAHVLKADHHGSCNGVTRRYLELVRPDWVLVSLGANNDYGHMHAQAKTLYGAAMVPWYRTDQNGTITIRSPGTAGGGYTITPSRGRASTDGPSDRRSRQSECRG